MSFFRKIFKEMDEIIASGDLEDSKTPFNPAREVMVGRVTDPDLKALRMLADRYEDAIDIVEKNALHDLEKLETIGTDLMEAIWQADFVDALFNIELTNAFPEISEGDAYVFRKGWLVVIPKGKARCIDSECPVHGAKARAARKSEGIFAKNRSTGIN